jgi:hypothetical protein
MGKRKIGNLVTEKKWKECKVGSNSVWEEGGGGGGLKKLCLGGKGKNA